MGEISRIPLTVATDLPDVRAALLKDAQPHLRVCFSDSRTSEISNMAAEQSAVRIAVIRDPARLRNWVAGAWDLICQIGGGAQPFVRLACVADAVGMVWGIYRFLNSFHQIGADWSDLFPPSTAASQCGVWTAPRPETLFRLLARKYSPRALIAHVNVFCFAPPGRLIDLDTADTFSQKFQSAFPRSSMNYVPCEIVQERPGYTMAMVFQK